ncbi:MAG: hypothetical protein ACKOGJ_02900, partial [Phycisphaerales bacterium]
MKRANAILAVAGAGVLVAAAWFLAAGQGPASVTVPVFRSKAAVHFGSLATSPRARRTASNSRRSRNDGRP